MDQLFSLISCVVDLLLSFLMLHLQHAHTVAEEFDVVLDLVLVLLNLPVGSGLLHRLRKVLLLGAVG
jgi:hypothetical protein